MPNPPEPSNQQNPYLLFEIFNEIGIIEQLGRAILEARLPKGLIAAHFSVLNHLMRVQDGQTPLVLAQAFQVPKTSMSHTLKTLQERGLITLKSNPADGRSKQVWLTDAGMAMRDSTIQSLGGDFAELAEGFDMNALSEIKPTLTELRIFLDNHRNPKSN